MTKKKTVEFDEGWADELGLSDEEVEALMEGIRQIVENEEIVEKNPTRH